MKKRLEDFGLYNLREAENEEEGFPLKESIGIVFYTNNECRFVGYNLDYPSKYPFSTQINHSRAEQINDDEFAELTPVIEELERIAKGLITRFDCSPELKAKSPNMKPFIGRINLDAEEKVQV